MEERKKFAKSIDGQLPTLEQMRLLGQMTSDALIRIRSRSRDPELIFAVADAFHCLPSVMFAAEFKWSWFLMFLEDLQRLYPDVGSNYISMFDLAVRFP